jgi:hypothetical protein
MRQYHVGCLAVVQDTFAKARESCLKCRHLWSTIETDLQSERIFEITTISVEAGGVREDVKFNATLPLLRLSFVPTHEELLQEVMKLVSPPCDILVLFIDSRRISEWLTCILNGEV